MEKETFIFHFVLYLLCVDTSQAVSKLCKFAEQFPLGDELRCYSGSTKEETITNFLESSTLKRSRFSTIEDGSTADQDITTKFETTTNVLESSTLKSSRFSTMGDGSTTDVDITTNEATTNVFGGSTFMTNRQSTTEDESTTDQDITPEETSTNSLDSSTQSMNRHTTMENDRTTDIDQITKKTMSTDSPRSTWPQISDRHSTLENESLTTKQDKITKKTKSTDVPRNSTQTSDRHSTLEDESFTTNQDKITNANTANLLGRSTDTANRYTTIEDESTTDQPITVRLVNGVLPGEGRLEIYHAGQWGTICDDAWDANDVSVACRQLGYRNGGTPSVSSGFGFGSGTIWLDNVDCVGTETRIEHCPSQPWGVHNCGHDEDAGVYCYVPFA